MTHADGQPTTSTSTSASASNTATRTGSATTTNTTNTSLDVSALLDRINTDNTLPGTIVDLPIPGAWVYVPRTFSDDRGSFHEWFRGDQFMERLGYPFTIAQANLSRSTRNVIRGIHLADVPPGQAKLVTCVAGSITDVLVDLRTGSPTFGKHVSLPISDAQPLIVHIPLGVGHAFHAVSETAVVNYLVTETYNPDAEWEIHPFDGALGVEWDIDEDTAILSPKDQAAPHLADVTDRLPNYREVRGWEQELQRGWELAMDESDAWAGE
ncbi:dTDP-4-keto-6-deoxy-D-glucose epimerase [Corynebacterium sp. 320]|uniref:dTDP-4-dehydrorhamnose 3,5-epimerase family protein n=1 Tax=Corynebacterium TaxID=1716 RepID=UPI00125CB3F3|nr:MULTISPECIES: dTDP-4-dehydrorhamnose 3,5-epimerase family protein [Corynebacterium]KAB1504393.1 dTDP-4-keto-6-deoxy-D-glucose epimerase [Corynebacterium sp. 320]KAB1552508.1 dTDP-4-keto-6-deoxy-D-glucose epimerase [Corynebacterium sp. 321]KAB1554277.1 dTDP-4-keto-6-deoxy-D-glucose epimerase [Corynebacterium sp. 319]KAB3528529.1 dTDP-4-keto-6-deoxy-D-glucose epimerase [Corynebacterium sp. 250]KAB3539979.1 dTDP-4-keto-6-deoxy-D-glucose epimerase [Corynebacterium sp. 366]